MPSKSDVTPYVKLHRDGTVWARGQTIDNVPTGYWEWFRKDGIRMRSGWFTNGQQSGEWTTYDQTGTAFKVTTMKAKDATPATSATKASKTKLAVKNASRKKAVPKKSAKKTALKNPAARKPARKK